MVDGHGCDPDALGHVSGDDDAAEHVFFLTEPSGMPTAGMPPKRKGDPTGI